MADFLRWGQVAVPWTAAWSSEADRSCSYVRMEKVDSLKLRFLCDGIDTPGVGKPAFAVLHNERSRDVVRRRQCQICRTHLRGSVICMNQGERDGIYPLINDGLPMCDGCAAMAVDQCPGLQRAAAAGRLRIYRASEWLHAPVFLGQIPVTKGGNARVNDLIRRERGPVYSGIKLVLTAFKQIEVAALHEVNVHG